MSELVDLLKPVIFKSGKFRGTSGIELDRYFAVCDALFDGKLSYHIVMGFQKFFPLGMTKIVGSGFGGRALAPVLGFAHGYDSAVVLSEKEAKDYGQLIMGRLPCSRDKVLIVDDVCNTGGSLRYAIGVVRQTGAEVLACAVLVKRREFQGDVPLYHLSEEKDFLDKLE